MINLLRVYQKNGLITEQQFQQIVAYNKYVSDLKTRLQDTSVDQILKEDFENAQKNIEALKHLTSLIQICANSNSKEPILEPITIDNQEEKTNPGGYALNEVPSGKLPEYICYKDLSRQVVTWKELYISGIAMLLETSPTKLQELAQSRKFKTGDKIYLSTIRSDIESECVRIENTNIYIDGAVTALRACQRLQKICNYCQVDHTDFRIYIK